MLLRSMYKKIGAMLLCLGLFVSVPVAFSAESASQQFRQFSQRMKALSGDFIQESHTNAGSQKNEGHFVFLRPGKFRWEVLRPFPQIIASDGERVRQFDPDLNQLTIRPLVASVGSSPAHILFGKGALDDSFVLEDVERDDLKLQWLQATPKSPDPGFKYMYIGMSGGEIRQVVMIDTFEQESVITFSALNTKPSTDVSVFTIIPPNGTDVVELTE